MKDQDRPRPVFDPALPARDRALLAAAPERLVPAHLPAPAPPRAGLRTLAARAVGVSAFAFFYGVLPGGWLRVLFVASLDQGDLVGGAARWGRRAVAAMLLLPAVQVALILLGQPEAAAAVAAAGFAGWAAGALRHLREPAASRAAREHHGRYLLPADLDPSGAALLVRAQRAVDAALAAGSDAAPGSRPDAAPGSGADAGIGPGAGAGPLDGVRDRVVLPAHEWAIAAALAEHARLRGERRALRRGRFPAGVRAVLEPQDRALEESVRSVAARVEGLEAYARAAADAADAHRASLAARDAASQDARYRDLLASTAADALARAEIDAMAEDALRAAAVIRAAAVNSAGAVRPEAALQAQPEAALPAPLEAALPAPPARPAT